MRTWIRNTVIALVLAAGIAPVFAQAPPPVPALPDAERRVAYSITGSLCSCAITFQLYGDSSDYANWLEVYVGGTLMPQAGNWTIASPSGSIATMARPITDAVLTFTAVQTGTVQIVGARRPRRTSQFQESQPVPTRNFNVVFSDITATLRELWDKTNDFTGRSVRAPPGETLVVLAALANRQNMGACFDSGGNLAPCVAGAGTLTAGNGILFTGANPTTISNNIQAGAGITLTGTNPIVIASLSGTGDPGSITNCALAATVSANALTVSLKTSAGVDPTPTAPCNISFRNATAANGTYTNVSATGPVSFSTGVSGSTFGAANATPFRLWITAFNFGGISLGVSKQATATAVLPIDESSFPATGACAACTTANVTGTIYTTAGLSATPVRALGYMDWSSGLTTAGVWNIGPTKIQMMGVGIKKPGEVVQSGLTNFAAGSGSSTTSTSFVSTNVTQSITLTSTTNSVAWAFALETTINTNATLCTVQMSRGGVGVGPILPGAFGSTAGTNYVSVPGIWGADLPGSIGPLTYTVQAKSSSGVNPCIWNDGNGGGGISLAEIMN